jgi:murein DD-endopeptidase MepM/ murein hydrolase activator NlpD
MYPKFCYPLNLPFVITQKWNENPAFYNTIGLTGHNGWDFGIKIGTPVYACHDGVVFLAAVMSDGALQVEIDTIDGNYRTFYAHLSEMKVNNGQKVKKGELIGLSGNTGRYTTGPHLHFGVHPIANMGDTQPNNGYGGAIDPVHFFDGTYPNSKQTTQPVAVLEQPQHVKDFIKALTAFQKAEGIVPAPRVGPKTTAALKKYKLI